MFAANENLSQLGNDYMETLIRFETLTRYIELSFISAK